MCKYFQTWLHAQAFKHSGLVSVSWPDVANVASTNSFYFPENSKNTLDSALRDFLYAYILPICNCMSCIAIKVLQLGIVKRRKLAILFRHLDNLCSTS